MKERPARGEFLADETSKNVFLDADRPEGLGEVV